MDGWSPVPTIAEGDPHQTVAFVSGSKERDGNFRMTFQLYRGASDLGLSVRWIDCVDPGDAQGRYGRGEVVRGIRLPSLALEMGVNRLWTFPRRLRDRPEARIFLGDPTFLNVARGPMADRTIVEVHDLRALGPYADRRTTRWMFRHVLPRLRSVRRVVVHSHYVGDDLRRRGLLEEEAYLLPPHADVDPAVGKEHLERSVRNLSQGRALSVLYVASDRPYKNIGFFLDLAHSLRGDTDPRFRWLLVSRLTPGTQTRVRGLRLDSLSVRSDVPSMEPAYAEADVLAFPSLYEGFGLPLVEAMARGIPVVATDVEPIREVVGTGGALVRANDLVTWSEALRRLGSTDAYRSAAERALERALEYRREGYLEKVVGVLA